MRSIALATAAALLLGATAPVAAHHNWLLLLPPGTAGDAGLLVACFGHVLPLGDSPPARRDYGGLVLVSPAGVERSVPRLTPLGRPAVSVVDLPQAGLWCAASWREHYGCTTTQGYQRGRRREVEARGYTVVGSKHTFRYGKTYALVGDGEEAACLRVGHDLEMVPGPAVAHLEAGDSLPLTVLFQGRPAPGLTVSGTRQGSSEELAHPEEKGKFLVSATADERGRVTLPLDEAGRWFFITEQVVDNPEPGVDKLYRSATLTVEVRE